MGDTKCGSCDLAAEAGAYCGGCAARIMARALNPFFGGRRKKSAGPETPRPARPVAQQRLFR